MVEQTNKCRGSNKEISRRSFIAVSGAAISPVGIAGCLGEEASGGLTIGWYGPLTGPADDSGEHKQQAVELAVDIINENGGVGGEDIEVVFGDSESEPSSAVNAVEQLIQQEQADVIGGGFHSDTTLAVTDVTYREGIPQIIDEAVSGEIVTKINDEELWNVFKTNAPSEAYSVGWRDLIEDFTQNEVGYFPYDNQEIALIGEETSYGLSIMDLMREELNEIGWTVISEDEVALDETEFTSLLSRIESDDPDIVWSVQTSTSGTANLVQQFQQTGFEETHLFDNFGLSNPAAVDGTGDASDGVITLVNTGPVEDTLNEWGALERWEEEYPGEMLWGSGVLSFQNIVVISEYVEAMGGPEALREADISEWQNTVLNHDPIPGGTGMISFQDNHQAAWGSVDDQPPIGYQILDGEINIVWPEEIAVDEINEDVYN